MYLYNPLHYCHTKSLQNILNLWLIPNYHIWENAIRKHVHIMYFMSAPYQHTSNVKPEQTQNTDTLPPLFRLGNFQNKHRPIQFPRIISFQQTSPSYRVVVIRVVVIAQHRSLPLVSSGLAVSVRIRGRCGDMQAAGQRLELSINGTSRKFPALPSEGPF